MKKHISLILAALSIFAITFSANAQAYQIANQIPQLLAPALSGSFNYRGFVEASYSKGVGEYNADFVDVSTSQGFQYASWFYMGVGIGIDGMFSHPESNWGNGWNDNPNYNDYNNHNSTTSCVMIPIFTDFRFNFGSKASPSFFADFKLGCAFLTGSNYIRIGNGYLTNSQYLYFKPTVGVRIPVAKNNTKQAVNVGINYQLLTSNYWYGPSRSATINSLGASVGFEW